MESKINKESTDELLSILDDEIERKCFQLKQKQNEKRIKKVFFFSCLILPIIFIISVFTGFSITSFLVPLIIFEIIAFAFVAPLLLNINEEREALLK
ncbi:hypothetical protein [Clostridium sp.]|uniref:hypothetical protein n=1 Tax=Clostridium sp. TaxID=1506 RepID=UPI00283AF61E|nr:hypothetical protein [Clostridium sp.]MDR3598803.1 hypothetical protein [Clostridium sp.]